MIGQYFFFPWKKVTVWGGGPHAQKKSLVLTRWHSWKIQDYSICSHNESESESDRYEISNFSRQNLKENVKSKASCKAKIYIF